MLTVGKRDFSRDFPKDIPGVLYFHSLGCGRAGSLPWRGVHVRPGDTMVRAVTVRAMTAKGSMLGNGAGCSGLGSNG